MVVGFWATLGLGLLGGVIAELIRIAGLLRQGQRPGALELLGSVIYAALGAGAVLFGWTTPHSAFEVAVLGAAFPALFASAVGSAGAKPKPQPLAFDAWARFRSWVTGS